MTKQGVTVIVCCYNSVPRLSETLKHLHGQNLSSDIPCEILIVDNASTDHTFDFAKQTWASLGVSDIVLRIVTESTPGQMHARIKGAKEARYEHLIFCDDDNWLHPNYISTAFSMMNLHPGVGAGGGQNIPATDAPVYPDWFEEYRDKYALGVPDDKSGDISHRGFVLGAGMVTRRSLFLEIFNEKYPSLLRGRNGNELTAGDDFEYCKRLLLWDYSLYYDQHMLLWHFIPKERLNVEYRERLMQGIAEAGKVLAVYDSAIEVRKVVRNKNRWRLLILSPFRILFSKLGLSSRNAEQERLKLFYLSPFTTGDDPVKKNIKKFINRW